MTFPGGETVVILDGTVTGRDVYGNDVATYPVKATYTGVPVAPRDSNGTGANERTDFGDMVTVGLTVFLPAGAVVDAKDRATVRGRTWDVVGDPQQWVSPFTGWAPGMPVALTRVEG